MVNDRKLNAFVIDTQHILIHSGLILKMKTAAELQAVIAHEVAHIANGHITRRLANMRSARNAAGFGMLLAIAVGAASGEPQPPPGSRSAPAAARSASCWVIPAPRKPLPIRPRCAIWRRATSIPIAMSDVLDYFRGQEALSVGRQDPYVRSHPLTRDRIRAVKGYAAAYGGRAQDDPKADYWFLRAKGKLGAFLQSPGATLRQAEQNPTRPSLPPMRRADRLSPHPEKGPGDRRDQPPDRDAPERSAIIRNCTARSCWNRGEFKAAVAAYGRAVNAAPNEPLILAGYGRALVALGTPTVTARRLACWNAPARATTTDPRMMRDLAVAYAKTGNNGMASLATAERYALLGNLETAAVHAKRAEGLLPRGSAGWNRAQDVLIAAKTAAKRR